MNRTGRSAVVPGSEAGEAAIAPGTGRRGDGSCGVPLRRRSTTPIREGCPPVQRDGMLTGPSTPERRHPR